MRLCFRPCSSVSVVVVKAGKKGRFRWSARDAEGNTVALSPVRGWDSRDEAEAAALRVFSRAKLNSG